MIRCRRLVSDPDPALHFLHNFIITINIPPKRKGSVGITGSAKRDALLASLAAWCLADKAV